MKTRKIFAVLLTVCMLLSTVGLFTVNAENTSLEEKYAKLYAEKEEYIKNGYDFISEYLIETNLTVLLYTDDAKKWTFQREFINTIESPGPWLQEQHTIYSNGFYIGSPNIEKAVSDLRCRNALRACIQYFDIAKEDLIAANKKMQEEPDSILEMFPMLSDEDIELARKTNGLFCERPIPEFMIEALYLEDDRAANNLLLRPDCLYLDYNLIVSAFELNTDIYSFMTVEELAEYDLKPVWVEYFINRNFKEDRLLFLKSEREYQLANPDISKIGLKFSVDISWYFNTVEVLKTYYDLTPPEVEEFLNDPRVIAKFGEENIARLKVAREKQLKNPSTGEEVYLIPVAIVSLALGALVIYPRRRKIDNI